MDEGTWEGRNQSANEKYRLNKSNGGKICEKMGIKKQYKGRIYSIWYLTKHSRCELTSRSQTWETKTFVVVLMKIMRVESMSDTSGYFLNIALKQRITDKYILTE